MNRFATLFLLTFLLALPARAQLVYVASQGNFTDADGSVVQYDPATNTAEQVFGGPGAGTILQSLLAAEERVYVMSSTAEAVDVLDADTGERIAQVTGVVNPRYMALVGDARAYVTGQRYDYSTSEPSVISVIDLVDLEVTGTIELPRQPEGLAVVGDSAYVALGSFGATDSLAVISTEQDAVARYVDLGCASPRYVFADAQRDVYTVCQDAIVVLDAETGAVVQRLEAEGMLGTGGLGQDAFYDPIGQRAYVVNQSEAGYEVLMLDTLEETLTLDFEVPDEEPVLAIGYDAGASHVYLGRCVEATCFTNDGYVTLHDLDGVEVGRFTAGVAPVYIGLTGLPVVSTDEAPTPSDLALAAPQPHPATTRAALELTLEEATPLRAAVYNALGQEVAVLAEGPRAAGTHTLAVEAAALAPGLYVVRVTAAGRSATQRLVVVR